MGENNSKPRCPSADEWIRKLWYIYTMECYSAIKKNTFESVLIRWMKLKSFCITKDTISKVKRQPSEWEKIIVNEATDKELISKINLKN